jgi:hypothetical protein
MRLDSSLTPEPGFSPNPSMYPHIRTAEALALESDGRIVVGGSPKALGGVRLVRLLADGSVDPSFNQVSGGGGTDVIELDHADRILVGGTVGLRRFLPDGSSDPAFTGWTTFTQTLALQEDGKILAPGSLREHNPSCPPPIPGSMYTCTGNSYATVSRLQGEDYRCDGREATHVGTETGETIAGSVGPDVVVALGGDDTVNGDAGNDLMCGDGGRDRILGANGADRLLGGMDDDHLFARDGATDLVDCGQGSGDAAQTDQPSLDRAPGCEAVDALAEPKRCKKNRKKAKKRAAAAKKCKKKKKKKTKKK